MTCLNCDSLQCVTVNRESYSWLIVAYCSQSPTFICPIVSFASRNTLLALRTCVLKQEISLTVPLGLQKKKKRKIVYSSASRRYYLFLKVFLDISWKKRRKEEKEIKKKKKMDLFWKKKRSKTVQKWTPVRYHRFDEKFLFVIGGISPVYRYFTASPYYK